MGVQPHQERKTEMKIEGKRDKKKQHIVQRDFMKLHFFQPFYFVCFFRSAARHSYALEHLDTFRARGFLLLESTQEHLLVVKARPRTHLMTWLQDTGMNESPKNLKCLGRTSKVLAIQAHALSRVPYFSVFSGVAQEGDT